MREISGDVSDGAISEDMLISGRVKGDLTVPAGRTLELCGEVSRNLNIEDGGHALIAGHVGGDVVNRGQLDVRGTIDGALIDLTGRAIIAQGACVSGR